MFRVTGRQTGTGAGRHPEDQQGEAEAPARRRPDEPDGRRRPFVGVGGGRRRADRRVQIDVRTVGRGHVRGGRQWRRPAAADGRLPIVGQRRRSDGHRPGGQAQTVHVGHGGVQPGLLRRARVVRHADPAAARPRDRSQQPGVPAVPVHDRRKRVQPVPAPVAAAAARRSGQSTAVNSGHRRQLRCEISARSKSPGRLTAGIKFKTKTVSIVVPSTALLL